MHSEAYVGGSEPKVLVGKKRDSMDMEGTSDGSFKRVKMRDIGSVFRSEERGSSMCAIDLNVGSTNDLVVDDASICIKTSSKLPSANKEEMNEKDIVSKPRGFDLDLNADDISSSANESFYPYKNYEHLKSRDESECGSSVGPIDEKDSMRVWKGLKQNNNMSSLHGSMPVPKPRGRKKSSNDVMKKSAELGKKEQVDRFAKIAAPSGLLNGLNPGIINHVRNSKQVRSIIEAMTKFERDESNNKQKFDERKDVSGLRKGSENPHEVSRVRGELGELGQFSCPETELVKGARYGFMNTSRREEDADDGLSLKLSSHVAVASENTSCLSNDESGNLNGVTSLAVQAANVASQWLGLLSQDIKGRLSALRRSRKRVQAVLTTELPSLFSRELSSKDSSTEQASLDAHHNKWSSLFVQMERALSEEENLLETWSNQVREMQGNCDKGLNKAIICPPILQHEAPSCPDKKRLGDGDEYLAVNAAAASLYSTCNFLMSAQNQQCG